MCGKKKKENNSEFQMGTQTVCLVFFLSFYLALSLVIYVSIDI